MWVQIGWNGHLVKTQTGKGYSLKYIDDFISLYYVVVCHHILVITIIIMSYCVIILLDACMLRGSLQCSYSNAPINVYTHYPPPGLPEVRLGNLTSPSLKASTWGPCY